MTQTIFHSPARPRRVQAILYVTAAAVLAACGGGEGTKRNALPSGGGSAAFPDCVATNTASAASQVQSADVVDGGKIYDKWYAVVSPGTEPAGDMPVWQQRLAFGNTTTGAGTWRCKECHGWDYAGKDGAYGPTNTSKYTGFPGILPAAAKQPAEIFCAIKVGTTAYPNHNFGAQPGFGDEHVWNVTKFVIEGALDTRIAANPNGIAPNGGIVGGNVTNGETVFGRQTCGSLGCHGPNGNLNVGKEGLGGLSIENPWEVLHKLRFGAPGDTGRPMPAFEFVAPPLTPLTRQQMLDVITFMQSPTSNLDGATGIVVPPSGSGSSGGASGGASGGGSSSGGASGGASGGGSSGGGSSGGASGGGSSGGASGGGTGNAVTTGKNLGGRLYDNHFAEVGRTTTTDNPLWALRQANQSGVRNPRNGLDTWRCKECHGWDYKGKDGVYGQATGGAFYDPVTKTDTHFTGFPGILRSRFTEVEAAFNYLKNGVRVNINNVNTLVHAFGVDANGQALILGSPGLNDDQIRALAQFVVNGGVIDTDQYILGGIGRKGAIGDPIRGEALYTDTSAQGGQCVTCHGVDGKTIDFDNDPAVGEYVGTLAQDNPWESLHKIRFGNPGDPMPSALQNGLTDTDSANILRYTQQLPAQ